MVLSAEAYLAQLQALLPPGSAWPRAANATLTKLLGALAEELARLDARALALIDEADGRSTLELLSDWERVCGLPDPCPLVNSRILPPGLYAVEDAEIASFTRLGNATYFGSDGVLHTAADNQIRRTYDPVTHAYQGLLIEESRTNLLTYSEQFDNAAWAKAQSTVITNAATAPDGTLTACKLVESPTANYHYLNYNGPSVASGIAHTMSVFIRGGEVGYALIKLTGAAYAAGVWATLNLATGAVTWPSSAGVGVASACRNGWWRFSISAPSTAAGTVIVQIFTSRTDTNNPTYTGDGASGVYVWGAQLESAGEPSSYINTTGTIVTRPVDECAVIVPLSLQERRAAIMAKLTAQGGASKAYFIALAASMGYVIEIDEFRPFITGMSRCGDRLNGGHAVRYQWRVRVVGARFTAFRAGASQCGDLLGKIARAQDLECKFKRLKPAHSRLTVSYEGA